MSEFYIYDLETLPNFFSFTGKIEGDDTIYTFELSDRKNQRNELLSHLSYLQNRGVIMVGYNNLGFDYPIIHDLLTSPHAFTYQRAAQICREIIDQQNYGKAGARTVWAKDRVIPQLDLMKINHFDNANKRTSLKSLQFAMRSESVEDLPYPFDQNLTHPQMDEMITYNVHDVTETEKFLGHCKPAIEMRQDLIQTDTISGDVLNFNDVKIGVEYLIKKIGRSKCFVKGSVPHQSIRGHIPFKDIILPIEFKTEPFQKVHDWFLKQEVWIDSEAKPKLETTLAGLQFHFGLGGVHASVNNKVYKSNETHMVCDIDVAGMYVAVAISNGFYPEHLGQDFVTAYEQLQRDRKQYPKGTTMNAVLKLAGNGVYGNSNNKYSCFLDPKYTFSVTANGQLHLLKLIEHLSLIPGLEVIQANTDGVTVYMPRDIKYLFDMWCRDWEKEVKLVLEEVEYEGMWIADVNNYITESCYKDIGLSKIKSKGRYFYPKTYKDYEGIWNKDFSAMVVQKGIEQIFLHGHKPEDVIRCLVDPFDFMLRYKTTGGSKVYIGEQEMSKTVRYYMSKTGQPMKKLAIPKGKKIGAYKIRPKPKTFSSKAQWETFKTKVVAEIPEDSWDERIHTKKKTKYAITVTSIQSGKLVKECNHVSRFNWDDVDYDYYIEEMKKLIIGENHV